MSFLCLITVFNHTLALLEMVRIKVVCLKKIQSVNQVAALLVQVLQQHSYLLADSPVAVKYNNGSLSCILIFEIESLEEWSSLILSKFVASHEFCTHKALQIQAAGYFLNLLNRAFSISKVSRQICCFSL